MAEFFRGKLGVKQWPDKLMLSLGHGIRGRLKGDANSFGGAHRRGELILSLDTDLSQINVKSKFLKGFLEAFKTDAPKYSLFQWKSYSASSLFLDGICSSKALSQYFPVIQNEFELLR